MSYSIAIETILLTCKNGRPVPPGRKGHERRGETMSFQIGSTLLDACVLSVLAKGDAYGYVLTQAMKQAIDISESTLYPVLRRLQKEGLLRTYDEPYQGRNRRYYAITETGLAQYRTYAQEWEDYKTKLDKLIAGGKDSE